jgi:hypothetical protein
MLDWLFGKLDERNDRRYVRELVDMVEDIMLTVPSDLQERALTEVMNNRDRKDREERLRWAQEW